jgi:galactokinase
MERFGRKRADVRLIRSPYRICPLGAHIDHQLGPVSALAVDQGIDLAFVANPTSAIDIASEGFGSISFSLDGPARKHDWSDYARGAVYALTRRHRLKHGVSLEVAGALAESGISSSAAIGLGYLLALASVNGITLPDNELIELDRVIENEFLGLKNGILDQSAITLARAGALTVIDCATHEHDYYEQPSAFNFLVVYSGLREALIDSSKFNNRVDECPNAGAQLQGKVTGKACGPIPLGRTRHEDWERHGDKLDPVSRNRARHFFTESRRVLEGAEAWRLSDREAFGKLMVESCHSSINNYDTGSPEMIRLFEILASTSGVYGARFSGAGFRGCAIALVDPGSIDAILDEVERGYLSSFPDFAGKMWAFDTTAHDGLRTL